MEKYLGKKIWGANKRISAITVKDWFRYYKNWEQKICNWGYSYPLLEATARGSVIWDVVALELEGVVAAEVEVETPEEWFASEVRT